MAEELYHWGIKGRSGRYPWGSGEDPYQRITRGSGSKRSIKEKVRKEVKKSAKEQKNEKQAEAKKYESLEGLLDTASKDTAKRYSDDELRDRITRLKLEREYRSLVSELNPKVKSKGKQFLQEVGSSILKESLKNVGTQAANYMLGEGLNALTGKKIYVRKGEQKKKDGN